MNDRRAFLALAGAGAAGLLLFGRGGSSAANARFTVNHTPAEWRRILGGELKTQDDIKRAIQSWRADHLRV